MIKINNRTHLRTDDLRRFFRAALVNELVTREIYFVVDIGEDGRLKGAVLGDIGFVFLEVPAYFPVRGLTGQHLREFGQVVLHEFGHIYGLKEYEIPPLQKLNTDWTSRLVLRCRRGK